MQDFLSDRGVRIGRVVPATCVLVLLHFGQDFLKPLAIASMLSLVVAPLVRRLARGGLGPTTSTLVSVALVAACVVWMSAVLTIQLVSVAADLPRYRAAIETKVDSVREMTVRPFERFDAQLRGAAVVPETGRDRAGASSRSPSSQTASGRTQAQAQVQASAPAQTPSATDLVSKLLSALVGPVGEAGIVFVLLVFILLERESLGDRFIRLVGEAKLGTTVQALNDTAQGVSRFFLAQSIVNVTFGAVVGAGLWLIGIPHAALWGAIAGLLRFVPYVGVLGAAALIALFSAAVDPGWRLVLASLGLFLALELLVAHVVEPQVYGHSTGLAPLAVIVSALFWGALWGPVGLLLSTPLTLCLVVVGRHMKALEPLTILLTDSPGLDAGQRFYQRALSGAADAIIRDARAFLRRDSFARYCDQVLLPGLALGVADFHAGRIDALQRLRVQTQVVRLAEAFATAQLGWRARRRASIVLTDAHIGTRLRQMREARLGRWQGKLDVPTGSIVLCVSSGSDRDELLTELLVRALSDADIDARSVSLGEPPDPSRDDKARLVGTVFVTYPTQESFATWTALTGEFRAALPHAVLATVRLSLDTTAVAEDVVAAQVDLVLHSYAEAETFMLQGAKTA
ncbi:MAG: AI-2E family transporter [Variovorax sp.]|nr:MAG: AI-2E family transporter [Variovorax sp.]